MTNQSDEKKKNDSYWLGRHLLFGAAFLSLIPGLPLNAFGNQKLLASHVSTNEAWTIPLAWVGSFITLNTTCFAKLPSFHKRIYTQEEMPTTNAEKSTPKTSTEEATAIALKCVFVPILLTQVAFTGLFSYFGIVKLLGTSSWSSFGLGIPLGIMTAFVNYYFRKDSFLKDLDAFAHNIVNFSFKDIRWGRSLICALILLAGSSAYGAYYLLYGSMATQFIGLPATSQHLFNFVAWLTSSIVCLISTAGSVVKFVDRIKNTCTDASKADGLDIAIMMPGILDTLVTACTAAFAMVDLLKWSGISMFSGLSLGPIVIACASAYSLQYLYYRIVDKAKEPMKAVSKSALTQVGFFRPPAAPRTSNPSSPRSLSRA
jgi:hypothetical protein